MDKDNLFEAETAVSKDKLLDKNRLRAVTRDILNDVDKEVEAELTKKTRKKSAAAKEAEADFEAEVGKEIADDEAEDAKARAKRAKSEKELAAIAKMSPAELAEFKKTLADAAKAAKADEDEDEAEIEDFIEKTAKEIKGMSPEEQTKYYTDLHNSLTGGKKFISFEPAVEKLKELIPEIKKLNLDGTMWAGKEASEIKAMLSPIGYLISLYDDKYARPDIADAIATANDEALKEADALKRSLVGENKQLEKEGKKAKYSADYIDMVVKDKFAKVKKSILKDEADAHKQVMIHNYLRDFYASENMYHMFMNIKPRMGYDSVSDDFDETVDSFDIFLNAPELKKALIKLYKQWKDKITHNSQIFDLAYRSGRGGQHERRSEKERDSHFGKDVAKLEKEIEKLSSDDTYYHEYLSAFQSTLKNVDEAISRVDYLKSKWADVKDILEKSDDELRQTDKAAKLKVEMETFELDDKRTAMYLKALEAALGGEDAMDPKKAVTEFEKAFAILDSYATEMKVAKKQIRNARNIISPDMSADDVLKFQEYIKPIKAKFGAKEGNDFPNSIYSPSFMKLFQKAIGYANKVGDLNAKLKQLKDRLVSAKNESITEENVMITELADPKSADIVAKVGMLAKAIRAAKLDDQEELLGALTPISALLAGKAGVNDADLVVDSIETLQEFADKAENDNLKTLVSEVLKAVAKMIHDFVSAKDPKILKESEDMVVPTEDAPKSSLYERANYLM